MNAFVKRVTPGTLVDPSARTTEIVRTNWHVLTRSAVILARAFAEETPSATFKITTRFANAALVSSETRSQNVSFLLFYSFSVLRLRRNMHW